MLSGLSVFLCAWFVRGVFVWLGFFSAQEEHPRQSKSNDT